MFDLTNMQPLDTKIFKSNSALTALIKIHNFHVEQLKQEALLFQQQAQALHNFQLQFYTENTQQVIDQCMVLQSEMLDTLTNLANLNALITEREQLKVKKDNFIPGISMSSKLGNILCIASSLLPTAILMPIVFSSKYSLFLWPMLVTGAALAILIIGVALICCAYNKSKATTEYNKKFGPQSDNDNIDKRYAFFQNEKQSLEQRISKLNPAQASSALQNSANDESIDVKKPGSVVPACF